VREVVGCLGEHDVGDVVGDRVPRAEREGGVPQCPEPNEHAAAQVGDVVDDIGREQLVHPVQLAAVAQVAVQVDQIRDGRAVLGGQRHGILRGRLSGELPV
jgi:hypothetical protein